MATTIAERGAPASDDVLPAAAVLADAGAARVLMAGADLGLEGDNVAVLLVAILDDLDYRSRGRVRKDLQWRASQASGMPVEVLVTDWPEWNHRIAHVKTSLEAGIAQNSTCLFARDPEGVNWGKEIGWPMSDAQEALDRLRTVRRRLVALWAVCVPVRGESNPRRRATLLQDRAVALAQESHLVMEVSLKTLGHAQGRESVPLVHDLDSLLALLHGPVSSEVRAKLIGLREPDGMIVNWRTIGSYGGDREEDSSRLERATMDYSMAFARAAASVAGLAAREVRRVAGVAADELCDAVKETTGDIEEDLRVLGRPGARSRERRG